MLRIVLEILKSELQYFTDWLVNWWTVFFLINMWDSLIYHKRRHFCFIFCLNKITKKRSHISYRLYWGSIFVIKLFNPRSRNLTWYRYIFFTFYTIIFLRKCWWLFINIIPLKTKIIWLVIYDSTHRRLFISATIRLK